ncbi:sigma-70 family RNA polymerase sigma factor [Kitasatospora xanthocidica]|uniref:RNA polymerase sigma factor n=1 Tax=Kitasatospora xanthocidica TaxID=83382 RepID=A0A372ZJH1_9ACTN|nr:MULTISPECIES: sigma-70 family RNA polymerase sigma factor [Streptomycetaceae]RGD55600.1 sigma-70 family RNA polymerase sigma factor [Kitasatospora xanthocidica]
MSKPSVAQPTSVTPPSEGPAAAPEGATAPARPTLDPDVLAEIHRLHGGYLLRALLRATGGDRGKAEDILQETLLRAWQHPEALAAGAEAARPWLFTVARRIAIDHYRMAAARAKEVIGETVEDRPVADDPYEQVVVARDLALALRRVQKHHREVLVELHLKDRSVLEASARLGVPPGTVKSRNFYAIRALRPVLATEHGYAPTVRGAASAAG